jgi:hypothetical protein
MAGWGEGPLRNSGEATVNVERYGPQAAQIEAMIAQCDLLTEDQLAAMAEAFLERGRLQSTPAWHSAECVSEERVKQAGQAAWDIETALKINGFDRDMEVIRCCGAAANDAGLAGSTRDLIGTNGYFMWDYDRLMYPWRVGAGDPQ